MKMYPDEGWEDEPFTAVLTLADGSKITLFNMTVNTIDAEVRETIKRYPARRARSAGNFHRRLTMEKSDIALALSRGMHSILMDAREFAETARFTYEVGDFIEERMRALPGEIMQSVPNR